MLGGCGGLFPRDEQCLQIVTVLTDCGGCPVAGERNSQETFHRFNATGANMKKLLLASALAFAPASAHAVTIYLGVGDQGSVVTLASGEGTASVSGAVVGGFTINLSGTGSPPSTPPVSGDVLLGGNIDVRASGGGSVNIWISSTGNTSPIDTSPIGSESFLSSFTQNLLTAGWTVEALTGAAQSNTAFSTQNILSRTIFTTSDPPDVMGFGYAFVTRAPYSLTELWKITAPSAGETNNTTDIAVPGPIVGAGLPGLVTMLLGLFGLNRYRRKRRVA
jgi:hypothetical protein